MKLNYRGVAYDYTPPQVVMAPSEIESHHSTLDWRYRNRKKAPVQPTTVNLMYRGTPYAGESLSMEQPVVTAPVEQPIATAQTHAPFAQGIARALMTGHHVLIKRREQSLLGRVAAEIGLGIDAANYWHPIQGKLNPSQWANYDRSAVAFS